MPRLFIVLVQNHPRSLAVLSALVMGALASSTLGTRFDIAGHLVYLTLFVDVRADLCVRGSRLFSERGMV